MFLCGRCLSAQLSALLNNLDTVGIMSYRERAQTQLWTPVTVIAVVRLDGSSNEDRFKDRFKWPEVVFRYPYIQCVFNKPRLYICRTTDTGTELSSTIKYP